ncbi:Helix-turn-helix domain [Algoriella xinjiangensis]|uniref:helix-turn-helix domain-containing protein n=1 Tax=Algoriella xinjiangensis TaxID=684065 RepID=UPI000F638899|nr:helix-turn-helix domain-containing protein [Algoriella xinjiangensis]VDH15622.1 Helix-turn-helix domain [Algoriella xinjiangensis]
MEQIQFISVSPEQFLAEVEKVVKKCLLAYDKQAKIEAQQKEVLTRKEVQELLSVSPTTLYNWEKESVLVPMRVKSRVYYSRKAVEAHLNGKSL